MISFLIVFQNCSGFKSSIIPAQSEPSVNFIVTPQRSPTSSQLPNPAKMDFDGDGKSDILWQNVDGYPAIWLMNGTTQLASGPILNSSTLLKIVGTGDFNGDRKTDILSQKSDGTPVIWLMNGLTLVSSTQLSNPGANWRAVGIADFDGDGKPDILWQSIDGSPVIWLMNGTSLRGDVRLTSPGGDWHFAGLGDFNGDGSPDILWQNENGQPAIWLMNRTNAGATDAVRSGNPALPLNPGPSWKVVGTGDFTKDGKTDILWQNSDGSPVVWGMNGTSVISDFRLGNPGASMRITGVADFNGDANPDIIWQSSDGRPAIWLLNGVSTLSDRVLANPGPSWDIAGYSSDDFKTGIGIVDITPPVGAPLAGGTGAPGSDGVDSRLYVRAMVLSTSAKTLVMVTIDTLKYPVSEVDSARQMIGERTGIPIANITITASHTHNGPYWPYYRDTARYPLSRSVADAVVSAVGNLQSSKIAVTSARAEGISANRRLIKDGTVWNRWLLSARDLQQNLPAEGTADPAFKILAISDKLNNVKALVYNFACHANGTETNHISADFPGVVDNYIHSRLGSQVTTFFLTGASGDVNPAPSVSVTQSGQVLGQRIVESLANLAPIRRPTLHNVYRELRMPGRMSPVFARADITLKWNSAFAMFETGYNAQLRAAAPNYPFYMTGLRIGNNFAIVTSPDELFNKFSVDIQSQSPFSNTMVIAQTNGAHGYIPSTSSFNNQGYETWFGEHSYLEIQAGDRVQDHSLDILRNLRQLGGP